MCPVCPPDAQTSTRWLSTKILLKSKLAPDVLGRIWEVSDIDQDGGLDKHEFVVVRESSILYFIRWHLCLEQHHFAVSRASSFTPHTHSLIF